MSATLEQLRRAFPEVDEGLIECIHSEERGAINACYEQLSAFGEAKMSKAALLAEIKKLASPVTTSAAAAPAVHAQKKQRHEDPTTASSGGTATAIAPTTPTTTDEGGSSSPSRMESCMSREATTASLGGGEGAPDLYDAALPQDIDELRKARHKTELNELMAQKLKDIERQVQDDKKFDQRANVQKKLGPQSLRHNNLNYKVGGWKGKCFERMIEREKQHCGEFVCFYHSFSNSMLIYEVHSCIARTIYGLREDFPPTARLLKEPFRGKPHVQALLDYFGKSGQQDHDLGFREVAISTSVSLAAPGSEAPPMQVFDMGYCIGVAFANILQTVLQKVGCSKEDAVRLTTDLANLGGKYGLPVGTYGASQHQQNATPGHMFQIFVRVDCVDDVAYGSHAMGVYDPMRNPLSIYLLEDKAPDSQARVFWHPSLFLDETKVKVYHYAAHEAYMAKRLEMQRAMFEMLRPYLFDTPDKLLRCFKGVEGLK